MTNHMHAWMGVAAAAAMTNHPVLITKRLLPLTVITPHMRACTPARGAPFHMMMINSLL